MIPRQRWLGIDFSGDPLMWRPGCGRSNVWIAAVEGEAGRLRLSSVDRVQALEGPQAPYERLLAHLQAAGFAAAGIDAPFSLPRARVPDRDHAGLLRRALSWDRADRPFPRAATLVEHLAPELGPRGGKEYRATEAAWVGRVNVRSTIWAGPRGGAAMTAASLRLLAASGRPLWPWRRKRPSGLLVEAFPAAQLRVWNLPWCGYGGKGPGPRRERETIVAGLRERIALPELLIGRLLDSADALDAVVCAFAAIAVTEGALATTPNDEADCEGWIAVHS